VTRTFVGVFALVMGVAIAATWTLDLVRGRVDLSAGAFRAREEGSRSLLWPHWLAEYGTAAALVAGGVGLLAGVPWGEPVALLGLGGCVYTSVNSLGWAFAERARRAYAIPMLIGAIGGLASAAALLAT
jgi:hypothetical protein